MDNLLAATIQAFGLNPALERFTHDLFQRGPDAAMAMNIERVAHHYGMTPDEIRDHRDLQFCPPVVDGVLIYPKED